MVIPAITFTCTAAAKPSVFSPPGESNSSKSCLYPQDKSCTNCHIHLYFPFTEGHLNHIRIYYHHADSAPADNTSHDKMEQRHHCLYITSYKLGCRSQLVIPLWSSVYMAGPEVWVSLHLCLSLTCVCYCPIQTIDINSCMRATVWAYTGLYLWEHPSLGSGSSNTAACEERFML